MNWDLWFRLQTQSRRAIRRSRDKHGNPYTYQPRGDLLERLSREFKKPKEQIHHELMKLHFALKTGRL